MVSPKYPFSVWICKRSGYPLAGSFALGSLVRSAGSGSLSRASEAAFEHAHARLGSELAVAAQSTTDSARFLEPEHARIDLL